MGSSRYGATKGGPIVTDEDRRDIDARISGSGGLSPEITEYISAASSFSLSAVDIQQRAAAGLGQAGLGRGPISSPEGWQRFSNGVLVNASTGQILFPTRAVGADPSEIQGSEQWLQSIQDRWSDKRFNQWRKKLIDLGYDQAVSGGIAEKGGAALDVISGLREYHKARYLNGGKQIPLAPVEQMSREAIRKQFDFEELKERAKAWGEVPFGEDLDDSTADYFAEKIVNEAVQLARKHPSWSFEQVETGAELRAQKEFVKAPGVRSALREAEEDEMDESLKQNIVSIAQLSSI